MESVFLSATSIAHIDIRFRSIRKRLPKVRCRVGDDFLSGLEEPIETPRPKFSREPFAPNHINMISITSEDGKLSRRKKQAPPPVHQSLTGAMIAAGCGTYLLKFVISSYSFLNDHPPAHDLPFGLTYEVNSFISNMTLGMGLLCVLMFGTTSVGLFMLAVQTHFGKVEKPQ